MKRSRRRRRNGASSRLAICLVALVAVGSCRPYGDEETRSDSNAFPLVPGTRWTYEASFRGKISHETLELVPVALDGEGWLGFVPVGREPPDLLTGTMVPDELFRRDGDTVWVADELRTDEAAAWLHLPLRKGATTTYRVGDRLTTTVVEGTEQLHVPAGTFTCTKLSVSHAHDGGTTATHTVWLAPGIGLVRWDRATGRSDRLVHLAWPPSPAGSRATPPPQ